LLGDSESRSTSSRSQDTEWMLQLPQECSFWSWQFQAQASVWRISSYSWAHAKGNCLSETPDQHHSATRLRWFSSQSFRKVSLKKDTSISSPWYSSVFCGSWFAFDHRIDETTCWRRLTAKSALCLATLRSGTSSKKHYNTKNSHRASFDDGPLFTYAYSVLTSEDMRWRQPSSVPVSTLEIRSRVHPSQLSFFQSKVHPITCNTL